MAGTVPICAYGQAGRRVPSLADLFDRVIQQSSRMHGISSDLHSKFREQLTEVILRLLEVWSDPMLQLYWSMSQDQNQDVYPYSSNKPLEIMDMVQELRDGVEKVAEKMTLEGVLGNTVGYISPESLIPSSAFSFYKRGELNSVDRHDLIYCFLRDSNKVKNYLCILKCTTLPGLDC